MWFRAEPSIPAPRDTIQVQGERLPQTSQKEAQGDGVQVHRLGHQGYRPCRDAHDHLQSLLRPRWMLDEGPSWTIACLWVPRFLKSWGRGSGAAADPARSLVTSGYAAEAVRGVGRVMRDVIPLRFRLWSQEEYRVSCLARLSAFLWSLVEAPRLGFVGGFCRCLPEV